MADHRLRPADDPPTLLIAVLDADVESWLSAASSSGASSSGASAVQSLHAATSQLLVFLNTFLTLHAENRVAVLVYARDGSRLAYPRLGPAESAVGDAAAEDDLFDASAGAEADRERVMVDLKEGLVAAVAESVEAQGKVENVGRRSRVSPSLATALCMVNRRRLLKVGRPGVPEDVRQGMLGGGAVAGGAAGRLVGTSKKFAVGGQARVLHVLAGGDVAEQYVPVMNCIFSAQRMGVPIDTCVVNREGGSTFFQQAAHLTGGVYMRIEEEEGSCQLLQTLLTVFLADSFARELLAMPVQDEVDFRASCFSTRKVIQEGYTCSVCLSTFDLSVGKRAFACPTCQARFSRNVGGARPSAARRPPPGASKR